MLNLFAHIEGEYSCSQLAYMPVVTEFQDIFANILGLPLVREINFGVDLMPGTQPIHKTPYRRAFVEM